jgi:hypothetical protein
VREAHTEVKSVFAPSAKRAWCASLSEPGPHLKEAGKEAGDCALRGRSVRKVRSSMATSGPVRSGLPSLATTTEDRLRSLGDARHLAGRAPEG